MRIRDPGWKNSDPGWKTWDPGSEMEKFGSGIRDGKSLIWDKHPGSATLGLSCKENNLLALLSL